ncbi:MAG: MFS transporter, partial [Promethearchaeota archaeon]
ITGKRREAVYGGVNAIVTKPAISIANSLFLFMIGIFGFVPPIIVGDVSFNQPQDELAKIGILVILGIIPACLLLLSALAMHWYPLDGPKWIEKKKFILELHEQKEKEYLQSLERKKDT